MINHKRFVLAIGFLLALDTGWAADNESSAVSSPETWASSPHADSSSESFSHWNDEGEIPVNCAACHSRVGFLDFIGADGSDPHGVDQPTPLGTVVDCETCHDAAVKSISSVTFPSGAVVENLNSSVPCLICHQGRASTRSVNDMVGSAEEDEVSDQLQFVNVHYRAAAATP